MQISSSFAIIRVRRVRPHPPEKQQLPQAHNDVHGAGYFPNVSDALPRKYTIRLDDGLDYFNNFCDTKV